MSRVAALVALTLATGCAAGRGASLTPPPWLIVSRGDVPVCETGWKPVEKPGRIEFWPVIRVSDPRLLDEPMATLYLRDPGSRGRWQDVGPNVVPFGGGDQLEFMMKPGTPPPLEVEVRHYTRDVGYLADRRDMPLLCAGALR